MLPQQRHQHKYRPQAINHAGNRRQQLGEKRQWSAQRPRAHLGQKDRQTNCQRNRNQQRQKRRNQCAVDKRQRAELLIHRIPVHGLVGIGIVKGLVEKAEPELVPGRVGCSSPARYAISATMAKMLNAQSTISTVKATIGNAEFPRESRNFRTAETSRVRDAFEAGGSLEMPAQAVLRLRDADLWHVVRSPTVGYRAKMNRRLQGCKIKCIQYENRMN